MNTFLTDRKNIAGSCMSINNWHERWVFYGLAANKSMAAPPSQEASHHLMCDAGQFGKNFDLFSSECSCANKKIFLRTNCTNIVYATLDFRLLNHRS